VVLAAVGESGSSSPSASFSSVGSSADGFGPPVLLSEYALVGNVIYPSVLPLAEKNDIQGGKRRRKQHR